MSITIAQSSAPVGNDRWKWSVWLEGTDAELDDVEYVVYTLHPTFPEPVRRINERETAFRLYSSGWGEFTVYAALHYRDGRVEKLEHWLRLGSDVHDSLKRAGSSAPPRRTTRGAARPRVYLSYIVADATTAKALVPLLDEQGVQVTTSEEIADSRPEVPFEQLIREHLRSVSHAVFLLSGYSSPWVVREAEIAQKLNIPRVFVRAAEASGPLPEVDMASLQVKGMEPENAPDVARAIARWAQGGAR